MADDERLQQLIDQILDLPPENQAELVQRLVEARFEADYVDDAYTARADLHLS